MALVAADDADTDIDDRARELHERTAGNPLFVDQLLRHRGPASETQPSAYPEPMRAVIDRRVHASFRRHRRRARDRGRHRAGVRRPGPSRLRVVSIATSSPDASSRRRHDWSTIPTTAWPSRSCMSLCGKSSTTGSATTRCSTAARGRCRRARGERSSGRGDAGRVSRVIAPSQDRARQCAAIEYERLSAEAAADVLAFEDVARRYQQAVVLLAEVDPCNRTVHCELLLGLARMRFLVGEPNASKIVYMATVDLARGLVSGDSCSPWSRSAGPVGRSNLGRRTAPWRPRPWSCYTRRSRSCRLEIPKLRAGVPARLVKGSTSDDSATRDGDQL